MKKNAKANWLRDRKGNIRGRWKWSLAGVIALAIGVVIWLRLNYIEQSTVDGQDALNSMYSSLPQRLQPIFVAASVPDFHSYSAELTTECGQLSINDYTNGRVEYDVNLLLELVSVYCETLWQIPIQVDIRPEMSVSGRSGRVEFFQTPPQNAGEGGVGGITYIPPEGGVVMVIIPAGYYLSGQYRAQTAGLTSEATLSSTLVHELIVHGIDKAEDPNFSGDHESMALLFQVKNFQELSGREIFRFVNR